MDPQTERAKVGNLCLVFKLCSCVLPHESVCMSQTKRTKKAGIVGKYGEFLTHALL